MIILIKRRFLINLDDVYSIENLKSYFLSIHFKKNERVLEIPMDSEEESEKELYRIYRFWLESLNNQVLS